MKTLALCLSIVVVAAFASALTPQKVTTDAQSKSEPTLAPNWRGVSITEFADPGNEGFDWQVVNDGVMGGLSKGAIEFTEAGSMVFSGMLSLENNGGFSTVRSGSVSFDLSNDLGLLLRVRGDGRTYEARLASDATFRGMEVSFSSEFATRKGEWIQVKLPFSEFKGSFRGTDLPDETLDASDIRRVGLLLGDKQQGPFELEVDYIRTYGKGQGGGASGGSLTSTESPESAAGSSLVEMALTDGRFTTLAAALEAAGLVDALQGDGPLTVFAPTDEAFAKLPEKVLKSLLKPENKDKLISILTYHVSSGASSLGDALGLREVSTLQGETVQVAFREGTVKVNEAGLIDADIECSNGIIHVIDSVLLPPESNKPERQTILTTAEAAGGFGTLLAAVSVAELDDLLAGDGPFTVFAPTDEAFAALPKGTVESLLEPENRDQLVAVLSYHVVAGRVSAGDALSAGSAVTAQGSALEFGVNEGRLQVNESTLLTVDVDGGNGLIHIIDRVLLPPKAARPSDQTRRSGSQESKASAEASLKEAFESIVAAIEKGVPLYNDGDPAACAEVYLNCIEGLSRNESVDRHVQRMLEVVIDRAAAHHSDVDRAWLFRKTLDGMLAYLQWSEKRG